MTPVSFRLLVLILVRVASDIKQIGSAQFEAFTNLKNMPIALKQKISDANKSWAIEAPEEKYVNRDEEERDVALEEMDTTVENTGSAKCDVPPGVA